MKKIISILVVFSITEFHAVNAQTADTTINKGRKADVNGYPEQKDLNINHTGNGAATQKMNSTRNYDGTVTPQKQEIKDSIGTGNKNQRMQRDDVNAKSGKEKNSGAQPDKTIAPDSLKRKK